MCCRHKNNLGERSVTSIASACAVSVEPAAVSISHSASPAFAQLAEVKTDALHGTRPDRESWRGYVPCCTYMAGCTNTRTHLIWRRKRASQTRKVGSRHLHQPVWHPARAPSAGICAPVPCQTPLYGRSAQARRTPLPVPGPPWLRTRALHLFATRTFQDADCGLSEAPVAFMPNCEPHLLLHTSAHTGMLSTLS